MWLVTGSLYLLGVLAVVVGVGASIALHEIGHMWPAKKFGVKVTQYMVGFGPTIWSRRRGETEYGVKAIPLGGYVRMIGMFPPAQGQDEGSVRASSTGRLALLVSDARTQSLEEVQEADRNRVFWKLPVRKRLVIMLGGPVMNLIISLVLFTITLMGVGVATAKTTVADVLPCLPTAANSSGIASADGGCGSGEPTAARLMDLRPGDRIVSVNGKSSSTWSEITGWIRQSGGQQVTFVIERNGSQLSKDVTVPFVEIPVRDASGNATGQTQRRGFLGVGPEIGYQTQGFGDVITTMRDLTVRSLWAVVTMPVRVYELAVDTVTGQGRALDSPVSVVGVADLGGDAVAAADEPVRGRIGFVLGMLAGLNLFLFLFNLLPVLPLDGGHVAGALWEGARRAIARRRGRPDPGPVDVARALPFAYAVTILLILISSVVIVADLVNPISL